MSKNTVVLNEIKFEIDDLNKNGCNIPHLKTLLGNNNKAVEEFLIKMYRETILKAQNSIKFTKSIKLINKNPSFNENFTFKNNTDVTKIIKNKQSKKAAFLMNFINSFTQILKDKNLNMLFTTQTIDSKYRHNDKVELEKNIMLQKDILNSFHRSENKHFYFFKKINHITTHNSTTREFIRSLEFHKDFNLHEHTIKVFDNSLEHTINYIKMYDKNRRKHKEIGRCEIVIPDQYKDGIIKAFNLQPYKVKDNITKKKTILFYHNDKIFKGNTKNGNQLCIKFFDQEEEINKQIVKYLVSYLNKNEKDIYQHIFNNLKIKNFTHSKVLFSKSLYEKIYKHFNKHKALEKYKSLYNFTKDYHANKIDIRFDYENTIYSAKKLDTLHNINIRFNDALIELDKSSLKYKKLLTHYNKFIERNKIYFTKMTKTMQVDFKTKNIKLKIDINKYKSVSNDEYKKIKQVDTSINSISNAIRKEQFIKEKNLYNSIEKLYEHNEDDSLDAFIFKDIMQDNIKYSKRQQQIERQERIEIIEENISALIDKNEGESCNFYVDIGIGRLSHNLELYKMITNNIK